MNNQAHYYELNKPKPAKLNGNKHNADIILFELNSYYYNYTYVKII